MYSKKLAEQYIKDLESHILYKHDESGTPGYPYCVAITMYPFLVDGLTELGGISKAPTDLKSYCGEFINLVYSVSSQFMGAVATPEFLMYMDYFIRKDYGENYLERLKNGEDVRAVLIERNLRLVVYIAKKFENTGIGIEDLISIGTIGLIKAINTFNAEKNIKLATYASRCTDHVTDHALITWLIML